MFDKFSTLIRKDFLVRLKLLAVLKDKKLYELIDEAIRLYLEKVEEEKNN